VVCSGVTSTPWLLRPFALGERDTRTDFHDQSLEGKAGFQPVLKTKQEDTSLSGNGLNAVDNTLIDLQQSAGRKHDGCIEIGHAYRRIVIRRYASILLEPRSGTVMFDRVDYRATNKRGKGLSAGTLPIPLCLWWVRLPASGMKAPEQAMPPDKLRARPDTSSKTDVRAPGEAGGAYGKPSALSTCEVAGSPRCRSRGRVGCYSISCQQQGPARPRIGTSCHGKRASVHRYSRSGAKVLIQPDPFRVGDVFVGGHAAHVRARCPTLWNIRAFQIDVVLKCPPVVLRLVCG
jgi:hypothetical protein